MRESTPRANTRAPLQAESTDAEATPAEKEEVPAGNSASDEEIRRCAYELHVERGEQPGLELDDWLQAERELKHGEQAG